MEIINVVMVMGLGLNLLYFMFLHAGMVRIFRYVDCLHNTIHQKWMSDDIINGVVSLLMEEFEHECNNAMIKEWDDCNEKKVSE